MLKGIRLVVVPTGINRVLSYSNYDSLHCTTQPGSLPGGVDAEALQRLTSNKELMDLMANEKLQVR